MFNYLLLIIFLIASGLCVGYANMSYWWGILPIFIGSFYGSYKSKFGQLLGSPDINEYQREKLLKTARVLLIMWAIISSIFFFLGYGLTKVAPL